MYIYIYIYIYIWACTLSRIPRNRRIYSNHPILARRRTPPVDPKDKKNKKTKKKQAINKKRRAWPRANRREATPRRVVNDAFGFLLFWSLEGLFLFFACFLLFFLLFLLLGRPHPSHLPGQAS